MITTLQCKPYIVVNNLCLMVTILVFTLSTVAKIFIIARTAGDRTHATVRADAQWN